MRRREFIGATVMLAAAMRRVSAQQAGAKMKRVAMVNPAVKPADMRIGGNPNYSIIFEEMKHLGYVEGANLIVDRYSAEGRFDRFPEIARDVVVTRPDVIFAVSRRMTLVLQSETRTIPVVAWTDDPVAGGIVSNLARPGGNITGVSVDAGLEIGAKHLQLLSEAVGKLSNVRTLGTPAGYQGSWGKTAEEAAERTNIPFRLEPPAISDQRSRV